MKIPIACCASALLLLASCCTWRPEGAGPFFRLFGAEAKICLKVVDDQGKPVEGAKVTGYFHFTEAFKTRTLCVTTAAKTNGSSEPPGWERGTYW